MIYTERSKEKVNNLTKEKVNNLKSTIADFLCKVEYDREMMKFECDENKWNDDVLYGINEGCLKLGFALASLDKWFEESNQEENSNK